MNRRFKMLIFMATFVFFCISSCTTNQKPSGDPVKWTVSTNQNRWKEKNELLISKSMATDTVNIEVLKDQKQQLFEGFGACFNELGWDALAVLGTNEKDSVMKSLFDLNQGLRLSIFRMPIGANDYSKNWYSLNETDGDYEMKKFNIDRDKTILIPYIKAAQKYNPNLKVWASPWCPPSWMKSNKSYACRPDINNDLSPEKAGKEGVTQFIMDSKTLTAYALYFTKFIKAYQEQGIPIVAVHVQNEPNSCQNFPSCVWTAKDLNTLIGEYLGPKLESEKLATDIWLGTIERPSVEKVDTVLSDAKSSKYVKGVGFQWAGKGAIAGVHQKYPNIKLMQTETECGNGSNDWAAAEYTFDLMKHYFTHGVCMYMYWNMVLDETGKSQWGWKQNSMISIDKTTKKVKYNPEYHLFKHFSYYIKSGAYKLKTSGDYQDILAFINPDGETVLIAKNSTELAKTITIKIGDKTLKPILEPKSFNTFLVK